MLSMMAPLSKAELIEQLRIAYENFARENQDVTLTAPVLLLVGDQDCTGKVKSYSESMGEADRLHAALYQKHKQVTGKTDYNQRYIKGVYDGKPLEINQIIRL